MPDRFEPVFYVRIQPVGAPRNVWHRINLTGKVTQFSYEDDERKADKLELALDNFDLSHFDDPVWRTGGKLLVSWGYPGLMAVPRACIIRKVTGFQQVKIQADGLEVVAQRETKHRSWENKKRSDVVREIANELGYRADDVLFIKDTEEVHEQIVQANLTDAQFIRRLAEKEDFLWFIDFDGFHFHPEDFVQPSLRTLRYYNIQPNAPGDILSFELEGDITAKPGRVKTRGRSPKEKKDVEAEVSAFNWDEEILAVVETVPDPDGSGYSEVGYSVHVPSLSSLTDAPPECPAEGCGSGAGGAALLPPDPSLEPGQPAPWFPGEPEVPASLPTAAAPAQNLLGPSGQAEPVLTESDGQDPSASKRVVPTTEETDAGAMQDAQKQYRRAKRTALKVKVKVVGDPTIVAKSVFELENVGKKLSQRWYIRNAKHILAGGGFIVDMACTSDGAGGVKRQSQSAPGLKSIGVRAAKKKKTKAAAAPIDPPPLQPRIVVDPDTGVRTIVHGKRPRPSVFVAQPGAIYSDPAGMEYQPANETPQEFLPPAGAGGTGSGLPSPDPEAGAQSSVGAGGTGGT